jgi:hypothetical protein
MARNDIKKITPLFLASFWLCLASIAVAQQDAIPVDESAGPSVVPEKTIDTNPVTDSKFTISDGTRVVLEAKGISIIPPKGWEVHLNYPNATLMLQVPYTPGMVYQRTVQVMRFKGALPIDAITGREYEKVIEQKFAKVEGSISDYRMRNHMVTKVEDGTVSILYYSEFTLETVAMMQAHILMSSATHHYLLTYTALAEHFEGEKASEYLTTAWESMVSAQVDSAAPMRLRLPVFLGFGAGFILLIVLLLLSIRKYRAGREYKDLLGDPYDEHEGTGRAQSARESHSADPNSLFRSGKERLQSEKEDIKTQEVQYIDSEPADEEIEAWNFTSSGDSDDEDEDSKLDVAR